MSACSAANPPSSPMRPRRCGSSRSIATCSSWRRPREPAEPPTPSSSTTSTRSSPISPHAASSRTNASRIPAGPQGDLPRRRRQRDQLRRFRRLSRTPFTAPPPRRRVVAAEVHDAVDEQRGRASHLTRRDPALDVALDSPQDILAGAILIEAGQVEPDLGGIAQQVIVLERLWRWNSSSCISQNRSCKAAASAAAAAASACGWISVSGKCRNAKRIPPGTRRSTREISRNACRE